MVVPGNTHSFLEARGNITYCPPPKKLALPHYTKSFCLCQQRSFSRGDSTVILPLTIYKEVSVPWWFGFRLEPIFNTDPPASKNTAQF